MKVAIIGKTGMLASMMAKVFDDSADTIGRPEFDIEAASEYQIGLFEGYDHAINAAGKIKPYCDNVQSAIRVNSLFPYQLPAKTIQIATDCVYSGKKGGYTESDLHDATDVYGKTKSLGENPHLINLRCSIIGPELKNHLSLLDWFLEQDYANGFTNHYWNGITTYHFAKIAKAVIDSGIALPPVQHIVPADSVTKADLLEIIAGAYNKDIRINRVDAPERIDRTLATEQPVLNHALWRLAGYDKPPTIKQMVEELAAL